MGNETLDPKVLGPAPAGLFNPFNAPDSLCRSVHIKRDSWATESRFFGTGGYVPPSINEVTVLKICFFRDGFPPCCPSRPLPCCLLSFHASPSLTRGSLFPLSSLSLWDFVSPFCPPLPHFLQPRPPALSHAGFPGLGVTND